MRFTSAIVSLINKMVAFGRNRSEATKIAFLTFKRFAMLAAVDLERAVEKANAFFEAEKFRAILNAEKRVFTVTFFAEKHGNNVTRHAISIGHAIEQGFYQPTTEDKRPDTLLIYFDLTQGGVRAMKKENFVSVSAI